MPRQFSKEQAAFLVAAALFLWVLVKLGLFITHRAPQPGTALAAATPAPPAEAAMADVLAPRSLDGYLARGARDPFFPDASQPTQLFIRSLVSHSLLRSSIISRYAYECYMSPNPLNELRFQLPAGLKVTEVFSKEMDESHKWGQDARTLIVPLKPAQVKRAYYRAGVTIVCQGPFSAPTTWHVPVVSCTDATRPDVATVPCEIGHIAIATPGDHVTLLPKEGPGSDLTQMTLEAVPKELAAQSNKLAYTFRHPTYSLTVDVKAKGGEIASVPTKGGPVLPPTKEPVVGPTKEPTITEPKEEKPKLEIPRVGDADALPFKLAAIVELREPEARRQAVLRNKDSGEYMRKFEGETVMDDLRVVSITDDAVVVSDSSGKQYRFADRFDDKYNATTPTKEPGGKQGPAPKKGGPQPKRKG